MFACAEPPPCITGNLKPGLIEENDDRTDAVQQQIKFATPSGPLRASRNKSVGLGDGEVT